MTILNRVQVSLRMESGQVKTSVPNGDAPACILEQAAAEPDTLIIMTTHGRSGLGRWLLGSVADKVIRLSERPTLVIRAGVDVPEVRYIAPQGFELPLDGSSLAEQAIPHAAALSKALERPIQVLHAAPLKRLLDEGGPDDSALAGATEQRALGYLDGIRTRLLGEGVQEVDAEVTRESPEESIIKAAGERGERWVVMTTHGRSGPARFVLGSVADRVIRHSAGPVLVVRPAH